MIESVRLPGFTRLLWFACKGNVFLHHMDIPELSVCIIQSGDPILHALWGVTALTLYDTCMYQQGQGADHDIILYVIIHKAVAPHKLNLVKRLHNTVCDSSCHNMIIASLLLSDGATVSCCLQHWLCHVTISSFPVVIVSCHCVMSFVALIVSLCHVNPSRIVLLCHFISNSDCVILLCLWVMSLSCYLVISSSDYVTVSCHHIT